jgi:hypothetical protein
MAIDPVSAVVGGVSAIGGIFQSIAADKAKKQDYLNQSAYASATGAFNQWQAGMNQKITTQNQQYQYWGETVQYNQQLAYTGQLRNYELSKELAQAERVGQARAGAGTNYAINATVTANQLQERGMQEAVAMQQYAYRSLQQSSAYQAMAQEGRTADRYIANFARQAGDYNTLMQINQGLEQRQYRNDQLGNITKYLNEYNSQQFYEPTKYVDPVAPFPPLPSLMMPPPPSMKGGGPSSAGLGLGIGTALLGGVNASISTASAIKSLK